MIARLKLFRAPIGVSLQDSGRRGYLRYGIAEGGPMDWARHRLANRMLGNSAGAAAIEFGPAGLGLVLDQGELQLSLSAPGFRLFLDGNCFSGPRRFSLSAGQTLDIRPRSGAMWGYLGLGGELERPALLASYAENTSSGLQVLSLHAGQELAIRPAATVRPPTQAFIDPYITQQNLALGVLPSAQYHLFSESERAALVGSALTIAPRFDRMAYQLQGTTLSAEQGHDILSDGITMGAIQVPGDGRPFVLMADHQPTGGYPKIACVCMADLPRLAQMAPGQPFVFRWVDLDEAVHRWQQIKQLLDSPTALRGIN